jgi:hypothetical protein
MRSELIVLFVPPIDFVPLLEIAPIDLVPPIDFVPLLDIAPIAPIDFVPFLDIVPIDFVLPIDFLEFDLLISGLTAWLTPTIEKQNRIIPIIPNVVIGIFMINIPLISYFECII